ncbi:hypothetical protein [Ekhidna sp.]|jgi:hypothetical protein|uniref:hypothetical protein n=1 Tax=Ekhidna sp. TaxID=2608089 RepID=UPI0032EF7A89
MSFFNFFNGFNKDEIRRRRLIAAMLTFVLSAWLGIDAPNMKMSVVNMFDYLTTFFSGPFRLPYFSSWLFLAVFFWWMYSFSAFVLTESEENNLKFNKTLLRFENVINAIHRSPNPLVFNEYPNIVSKELDQPYKKLIKLQSASVKDQSWLNEAIPQLRKVLESVLTLTQHFSNQDVELNGANIMLYFPSSKYESLVKKLLDKDKIMLRGNMDIGSMSGVLVTLPQCIVHEAGSNKSSRNVPELMIPAFKFMTIDRKKYFVPGAATAIIRGNYVTTDREHFLNSINFIPIIQSELKDFFRGDGKHIQSFASYRIGIKPNYLGVLNIDSSQENILGTTPEYYPTFNALINPFIKMIEPIIEACRDVYSEQLIKELEEL